MRTWWLHLLCMCFHKQQSVPQRTPPPMTFTIREHLIQKISLAALVCFISVGLMWGIFLSFTSEENGHMTMMSTGASLPESHQVERHEEVVEVFHGLTMSTAFLKNRDGGKIGPTSDLLILHTTTGRARATLEGSGGDSFDLVAGSTHFLTREEQVSMKVVAMEEGDHESRVWQALRLDVKLEKGAIQIKHRLTSNTTKPLRVKFPVVGEVKKATDDHHHHQQQHGPRFLHVLVHDLLWGNVLPGLQQLQLIEWPPGATEDGWDVHQDASTMVVTVGGRLIVTTADHNHSISAGEALVVAQGLVHRSWVSPDAGVPWIGLLLELAPSFSAKINTSFRWRQQGMVLWAFSKCAQVYLFTIYLFVKKKLNNVSNILYL